MHCQPNCANGKKRDEPRRNNSACEVCCQIGGKLPVNLSGGLLAKGHPTGATGVANLYEICTQLRGEAGQRQVSNAKIGLAHVIGLGSACGIHILEKP